MIAKSGKKILLVAAVLLVVPSLSWGSGFSLFEVGNRAMGMAGAFTAVADDPSALFWNPAGMAFQTDQGMQLMVGVTLIQPTQDFTGMSPYPGDGYTVSQKSQTFPPAHFFFGMPVNERLEVSFSLTSPFGLGTWWEDDYLGRFQSIKADLMVFDLGLSMAYKMSESFAFGIGIDYMYTTIELSRHVGVINPYDQRLTDVASAELKSEGMNAAWAWNAGLLWKLGNGFQLGAVYRSDFTVTGDGNANFTQIPTGYPDLDGMLGTVFPFDGEVPIEATFAFPDFWTVGLAWQNETWTFSGQYGVMGWSAFQELPLIFPENPEFSTVMREEFEDAAQWRVGMEWRPGQRWAFQLGYLEDETGQPVEAMSPLLADGDRTSYSLGLSYSTKRFRLDVGYEHVMSDPRSTEGGSWDGYDGTYDSEADLAGATVTFKF